MNSRAVACVDSADRYLAWAEQLRALPSLGWVTSPSPVTPLPGLAAQLGLTELCVKRDDLLDALHGGTKVRKLDLLLAAAPYRDSPRWVSLGAIGSGHLVACTAAAHTLRRHLEAHLFFEPLSAGVLENLASIASGPSTLHYYRSRAHLVLRQPSLLTAKLLGGVPVIAPGATAPASVAGIVRAALELAEQARAGLLAPPDVVYCALGTGGTAAGLALGLGLAGLRCEVRAVSAVEPYVVSARTVRLHIERAARWLHEHGVPARADQAVAVRVLKTQLGQGYGAVTPQSLAAVEILSQQGVPIEPVYTGKAFAALLAQAASKHVRGRVLFWNSVRRGPLPCASDWRERLPAALVRRIDQSVAPTKMSRRAFVLVAATGCALAWGASDRLSGYPELPNWNGHVLSPWQAQVIAAASDVLCGVRGVVGLSVAAHVDSFLARMPANMQREVHALCALVEHATTPLGSYLPRFTRLRPEQREAFLVSLAARGGLLALAVRGLRDLTLIGCYQQARSWPAMDYRGPWPDSVVGPEAISGDFGSFRAAPGALPRSTVKPS